LLDGDRTTSGIQGTRELNKEPVANSLDFSPAVLGERRPEQGSLFVQQLKGQGFVLLDQGAVADHVGEHDGGRSPLLVTHEAIPSRPG
jgi:hypothetical protein